MMQLTLLLGLQNFGLKLLIVWVLTDVPDLKFSLTDVLLEGCVVLVYRVVNMKQLGSNLSDVEWLLDAFCDFVVVISDVLGNFRCFELV